MAILVIALVGLVVVAVLGGLHWYIWRRLVRDTTRAWGPARLTGTVVLIAGPVLMIAALAAERGGAPFWLQRVLGWPGFLWMALVIYLLLAVLAGEVLRPLLRRFLEQRGQVETVVKEQAVGEKTELPASEEPQVVPASEGPQVALASGGRKSPWPPKSRRPLRSPPPPVVSSSPVSSGVPRPRPPSGPSDTARTASCVVRASSG